MNEHRAHRSANTRLVSPAEDGDRSGYNMDDEVHPISLCATTCPVCYDELDVPQDVERGGPAQQPADGAPSDTGRGGGPTARRAARSVRLEACKHVFCRPCLQDYCTFNIASTRKVAIVCPMTKPYCNNQLSGEEVRSVLVPEQDALYRLYVRLERMARDPSLSQCPSCEELAKASDAELQAALSIALDIEHSKHITLSRMESLQQILQQPDPNRRICRNPDCAQTVFCVLHGNQHTEQICAEFIMEQTLSLTDSSSDEEGQNSSSSINKYSNHCSCLASLETIRRFTKPCPHCGAAIHKASGCDHVVCPMCHQDFCFRCGTHEYLTSRRGLSSAADGAPSAFRNCARCHQAFIDHRYMDEFRRKMCWTLPLLLVGAIFYSAMSLLLCLATLCFCGCFGCGTCLDPEDACDSNEAATPTEPSPYPWLSAPLKGVRHGACILLLPFIGIARDFGFACSWFPERLPGEDRDDPEIPSLAPTASEDAPDN